MAIFPSLKAALAGGADIAIAKAASAGRAVSALRTMAEKFVGPGDRWAREALLQAGRRASQAGINLNLADFERPGWHQSLPINPELFGQDPEGRRVKFGVEFVDANGNPIVRTSVADDGTRTLQDLLDEALEAQRDIIKRYPGRFGGFRAGEDDELQAIITYAVRRF